MNFRFATAAVCVAAMSVSGCATITRGASEDVQFLSTPPGATVNTGLGHACKTPCTLKIDRRDTFTAVFTLGEQTQSVFVDTEVAAGGAAGVAGNVLFGGVIGAGVDVATGAGLNHVPNPVIVTFEPETTTAPATPEPAAEPAPAAQPSETGGDFKWSS